MRLPCLLPPLQRVEAGSLRQLICTLMCGVSKGVPVPVPMPMPQSLLLLYFDSRAMKRTPYSSNTLIYTCDRLCDLLEFFSIGISQQFHLFPHLFGAHFSHADRRGRPRLTFRIVCCKQDQDCCRGRPRRHPVHWRELGTA